MDANLFSQFRDLIYRQSGISLATSKQTLLQSRISKRMRILGIGREDDYLNNVIDDRTGEEMIQLLDAVSTNVTYFFREPDHFQRLQQALCQWLEAGRRRIRIWSAACSSGQEPYTIGMTALETLREAGTHGVDLRVLATDISTRVLEAAIGGVYSERELEHVSADMRSRYLRPSQTGPASTYAVGEELRRLTTFRRLNLSQPPFPMQGPFDAIFCRNVMIYFDAPVRTRLVADMSRLLRPGGLLFIGHAESLLGLGSDLLTIAPSVYQKATQS